MNSYVFHNIGAHDTMSTLELSRLYPKTVFPEMQKVAP